MYSPLVFALLTAAVGANPVANKLEAREDTAAAIKNPTCVLPTNATNVDSAATKRATPTSFWVYDASSDSFAVAHKEHKKRDSIVHFESTPGSNFTIDTTNRPGALRTADFIDSNGTPEYLGQEICGIGCFVPYLQTVNLSELAVGHGRTADGYATSVQCRISFNDDGSCPLVCHGRGNESWSCESSEWQIFKPTPPPFIPDPGCTLRSLYAVSD